MFICPPPYHRSLYCLGHQSLRPRQSALGHLHSFRIHEHFHLIPVFDVSYARGDHLQQRGVLEVATFSLRMWIVDPTLILFVLMDHFATRKGEMLGRM